jgi:3'-phosphoadenosine 5'-phosphosulfate sulfotransferase (PAPS reductase)/FAD synthetase
VVFTRLQLEEIMYKLPDDKVLISFSGGRTSGYMLHKIIEANNGIPDTTIVAFANTGREMPGTIDFVNNISVKWNVNIHWLEYRKLKPKFEKVSHNSVSMMGEPFKQMIDSKGGNAFLPNQAIRYCTQELKVKTIKRYLVSLGWKKWINTIGIRADESHRIKKSTDKRWDNWFPLADSFATIRDVNDFWKKQSFDLNIVKGSGNCDGCFLKSEATLSAMIREYPERMQWWDDMEQMTGGKFHKNRTYKSLSDYVTNQGDWIFDNESFLCQANDGECTG